MTDPAFVSGIVFGLILSATAAALLFTVLRPRRPRRDPIEWDERAYAPPVVTKVTINRIRDIEI